jgi:hypothetical protein
MKSHVTFFLMDENYIPCHVWMMHMRAQEKEGQKVMIGECQVEDE